LEKVGFQKVELIGETGFNSTPKTKGVLFRAEKPALSAKLVKPPANTEQSDRKVHPTVKKTPPAIEAVLEKAYAIGCEKVKIIDTSTVIIEKWTRWKLGIRQIREGTSNRVITDTGELDTSGVLSITRHPWYLATILLIWARQLDVSAILVNVILTSYLIVGTYLEEKKLIGEFGEKYLAYQKRVSMLIPY